MFLQSAQYNARRSHANRIDYHVKQRTGTVEREYRLQQLYCRTETDRCNPQQWHTELRQTTPRRDRDADNEGPASKQHNMSQLGSRKREFGPYPAFRHQRQ